MTDNQLRAYIVEYIDTRMIQDGIDSKERQEGINLIIRESDKMDNSLRAVTAILYDGLAYGNWPWVVARLNKHIKH